MVFHNNSIYITGLAHEYPRHTHTQDQFASLISRLAPEHIASPGFQRLLHVNRNTNILTRRTICDYATWTKHDATPPTIDELSETFRTTGVELTVAACSKALREAQLSATDITHVVAVTCTDQGSPGYDLFVSQRLQLPSSVQRTLLHGVGCAGGLSALREAANLAAAASSRGKPARILVFATELCSLFLRAELQAACKDVENLHIAPALFSDASAALVVCNQLAVTSEQKTIYELQEWDSALIPGTKDYMSYSVSPSGMIATIKKEVPKATVGAIGHMFDRVCNSGGIPLDPTTFDWALHPGGFAILKGAQQRLGLTDDHIRASLDVYQNYGNSSSPTVLIVLDKLRRMDRGRDDVVATSFGPGLMIEMFRLRRCRDVESRQALCSGVLAKAQRLGMLVVSKISKSDRKASIIHRYNSSSNVRSLEMLLTDLQGPYDILDDCALPFLGLISLSRETPGHSRCAFMPSFTEYVVRPVECGYPVKGNLLFSFAYRVSLSLRNGGCMLQEHSTSQPDASTLVTLIGLAVPHDKPSPFFGECCADMEDNRDWIPVQPHAHHQRERKLGNFSTSLRASAGAPSERGPRAFRCDLCTSFRTQRPSKRRPETASVKQIVMLSLTTRALTGPRAAIVNASWG
ncbi:hypothetical protein OPT61_g5999 [Boeremia exigua]|uniref:Uncharacterized protein n=1 Tax=Boeremia exigua TaxID=749465 RepID=A0ACC2I893_9PLEO|nr:hypothetical protein OPT61_g5999 [Boeremia exigua]